MIQFNNITRDLNSNHSLLQFSLPPLLVLMGSAQKH